jgi:hypothetical protein
MAICTLVIGEPGTGKSTSIRNLKAEETFIINVVDKPLPFKGFFKGYKAITKENPEGNYYATDNYETIKRIIESVNSKKPHIKNLIIDDFQYIMCNEFMRRAKEKGFEKFTEIGMQAWEVINTLNKTRPDLNCYILTHSDIDSAGKTKMKTIGKMLEEKASLEGRFIIVLHTIVSEGGYRFLTQHDGAHLARSPLGMFKDRYIPNDLAYVNEKIYQYHNEDINDPVIDASKPAKNTSTDSIIEEEAA